LIPLSDDRTARGPAVASLTLMALWILAFLWQKALGPGGERAVMSLAFVPGVLFGGAALPPGTPVVPPPMTLVTYAFLHGGWLHLLGNLLYMWVFAPRVEDDLGPGRFTVFFVVTAVAAALAQAWSDPASSVLMIGASGGVSGILGAYLLLHPRAEVRIMTPVFLVMKIVRLPAWIVLAAWFGFQLLYESAGPANGGGVAFRAHIGGFLAGLLLAPFFAPGWLRLRFAREGSA
jgi:membrane associated rhomboid family serine protease